MVILTSVWSAQHPNAGRNIQQTFRDKLQQKIRAETGLVYFPDSAGHITRRDKIFLEFSKI